MEVNPIFDHVDEIVPATWESFGGGTLTDAPFQAPINNYYQTDPISRASETMAQCAREFGQSATARTGTDG